jgi:hypothetical protein
MRLMSDTGIFSINNIDSNPVSSDGDNNPTAVNNIPLKVCPQQPLTLKDLVNGGQSRSFEITQNKPYFLPLMQLRYQYYQFYHNHSASHARHIFYQKFW